MRSNKFVHFTLFFLRKLVDDRQQIVNDQLLLFTFNVFN